MRRRGRVVSDAVRFLGRELETAGHRGRRPDGPACAGTCTARSPKCTKGRPPAVIGDRDRLSIDITDLIDEAEEVTADNRRLNLTIAISYGGRQEIVAAARRLAQGGVRWQIDPRISTSTPSRQARHRGSARPGSDPPDQRRAADQQLPALAVGLQRAGLRRQALAGLRRSRPGRRDPRVSITRPALWCRLRIAPKHGSVRAKASGGRRLARRCGDRRRGAVSLLAACCAATATFCHRPPRGVMAWEWARRCGADRPVGAGCCWSWLAAIGAGRRRHRWPGEWPLGGLADRRGAWRRLSAPRWAACWRAARTRWPRCWLWYGRRRGRPGCRPSWWP